MMLRPSMVVAGEALLDLLIHADGRRSATLGGSPFNLALALSRLGCHTIYRSPLSSDEHGRALAVCLRESGAGLTGVGVSQPTSVATVRLDACGDAAYSFEREGVADRALAPLSVLSDWPSQARFFHVGSLALIPPDGQAWRELLFALRGHGVTTSVDANMRTQVAPDASAYATTVNAVCAQANLLKVSDEDLTALGLSGDPLAAARSLLGEATRLVLLTLGEQGAWCLTREHEIFQAAPSVKVVDTVGAGDCFYAGFLASLDEQQALCSAPSETQLRQALSLGAQAAAFNLQRQGCQPPWRTQLGAL